MSIALMLLADDEGRGRASPVMLAGQVFPGLANPREASSRALEELEQLHFVTLYEVDGQRYYQIRNWTRHQRIDRPTASKLPRIPDSCDSLANPRESSREFVESATIARASRASIPIPDPLPDPNGEGVQGEGVPSPERLDGLRDDDRETPCPLDLEERWTGAQSMAEALKVPRAAVDAVVRDFVAYWTIGGGSGRRRSHWARKLRDEVRRKVGAVAQQMATTQPDGQPPRASREELARRHALCDAADARARAELMGEG